MKTLEILKREHRNLDAILYTLKHLVIDIEKNSQPVSFRMFHGIVYYLDSFLDQYHHPKENDYLFPAVVSRCPEAQDIVQRLEGEHAQGDILKVELLMALSTYEFLGEPGYSHFAKTVENYVEFERQHAISEEKELFPLARKNLTEEDWKRLDSVFDNHSDPLFGDEKSKAFAELYSNLAGIIPAPYGFGTAN